MSCKHFVVVMVTPVIFAKLDPVGMSCGTGCCRLSMYILFIKKNTVDINSNK